MISLTRNTDSRITFQHGDARELPFEDRSFDRTFSLLVLQFIPDAARAVAEMRRVVRPGGTIAAAVWDEYSGLPHIRIMWDIAVALDPTIECPVIRPLGPPGEMAMVWRKGGLIDVEQTSPLIRMEFEFFDDYWSPFATGEGPPGQFVAGLSGATGATLREHKRRAYIANRPDGPRSFACVAWACCGTVTD